MPPSTTPTPLSIEIATHLYKAFIPVRWYMMIFAKFPFSVKPKPDGTYGYEFSKYSPQAIIFYVSTISNITIFVVFTCGTFYALFTRSYSEETYPRDRCGQTWESTMFLRHFDVIIFSLTSFGVSGFSGFYLWYHKDEFCHYFNFWSSMMQKVQFDCVKGTTKKIVGVYIVFFGLFILSTILFFAKKLVPMEEASGFFIQALFFYAVNNLYTLGAEGGVMTVKEYNNMTDLCCDCRTKCYTVDDGDYCIKNCWNVHSRPSSGYVALTSFGYFILMYGILSTIAMFVMFEFYCRCLVNFSKCWNARLSNAVSADRREDPENELRRRLRLKPLMLDFGSLTETFQMTEELFGSNLMVYYGMLMMNLLIQLYFFALLGTQRTCSEWITANLNMNSKLHRFGACDNWDDVMMTDKADSLVSFEDPCQLYRGFQQQQAWLVIILLCFTLFMFTSTIWEGHRAVQMGLQGFLRLRKFNYMNAMTMTEKYFVHTLKLTYLGPCAIHISAANYFVIRRKLSIIVLSTCFMYVMMMVGFGPGKILPNNACIMDTNTTFEYPKIVG